MASKTLTSANCTFYLTVENLYTTPRKLEGYGADNIFSTDAVDLAETVMGADGVLHAGKIFVETPQEFQLMPDSNGCTIMENWVQAQETAREVYQASATFTIPSIGKKYTCTNGFLVRAPKFPTAGKILQAMPFSIKWGSVTVEDV
ncbi:phage tail fiber protein [Zymobacter sp. IVIA_12111.31 C1]|uniref:phage tail fiber protein n=1 Tax=Zymobacter sp. IVIA_12111.31 C1 TaxID=3394854 RepID=UPI0039C28D8E